MIISTIDSLAVALLATTITVFIFATALLGDAIERAREEETEISVKEREAFDAGIADIERKIREAKKRGRLGPLEQQLRDIKKNRRGTISQINSIRRKYSLLRFEGCVLFPGTCYVLAIGSNVLARKLIGNVDVVNSGFFGALAVTLIILGGYRLCRCLLVVEEMGFASSEFQTRKYANALKTALAEHEREREVQVDVIFSNVRSPLRCTAGQVLEIGFYLTLRGGKLARKVSAWWFVPDEFELIDPGEKQSWRQGDDHDPPRIRTVKRDFGDLSVGIRSLPNSIKVKCPNSKGRYRLLYVSKAEGYTSDRKEFLFRVR